jgi:hypothetical protein
MQAVLDAPLEKEKLLKIQVALNDEHVLAVEAWVVWHKNGGTYNNYGLYFTKINDSQKEGIYRFIQRNFPEQINRRWWNDLAEEKGGEAMEDRRIFERLPVKISLKFQDTNSHRAGMAQVENVSAKGLGLVLPEEPKPNTTLELWLQILDRSEPFYTRGKLVWSKGTGKSEFRAGVSLEKIDLMGISHILKMH